MIYITINLFLPNIYSLYTRNACTLLVWCPGIPGLPGLWPSSFPPAVYSTMKKQPYLGYIADVRWWRRSQKNFTSTYSFMNTMLVELKIFQSMKGSWDMCADTKTSVTAVGGGISQKSPLSAPESTECQAKVPFQTHTSSPWTSWSRTHILLCW